ncbi:MAG: AI-2E family transporter [Pirellulales bacterium]|nr:AI-2E family transporter [Pirellulales bacterium]
MVEFGRGAAATPSVYQRLVVAALVLAALYFGRGVLLPFALAVLLAFVFSPWVRRFERWGLPRVPAVVIVTVLVAAAIASACAGLAGQVVSLSGELPKYRSTIERKIRAAQATLQPTLRRIESSSRDLERVLEGQPPESSSSSASSPETESAPAPRESRHDVVVADHPLRPASAPAHPDLVASGGRIVGFMTDWLGPVLAPLGQAVLVGVFTIFLLVEREDLRNRVIVLLGVDQVSGTTQLLDEAVRRVSRYLRMQLVVNVSYGIALGALCWFAGVPNWLLWGALGAVLRFIPYLGPIVAAGLPLLMAVATTEGWTSLTMLAAGIALIELISNNVLEPWLYGSSVGVSPLGIILSACLWTLIWGTPGLILATPLTACITVLARHVPSLKFLVTLLGDEAPLTKTDRLYQRLLAGDVHESLRIIAEAQREEASQDAGEPVAVEQLLLAVLGRAVADQETGAVNRRQMTDMLETLDEVTEELADEILSAAPVPPAEHRKVLCLPIRGAAQAAAARVTALALLRLGWNAKADDKHLLTSEQAMSAKTEAAWALVIVAVGPRALKTARYLWRRLEAHGSADSILFTDAVLTAGQQPQDTQAKLSNVTTVASVGELDRALRSLRLRTATESTPSTSNLRLDTD